jgi:hypothetical protein
MRRILLMLALIASFAMTVPMLCPVGQAASHCPMHSTAAPCCRVLGCFSSRSARHEVASLKAPAQIPTPALGFSLVSSRDLEDFIRTLELDPSPPRFATRSIDFRPLLI